MDIALSDFQYHLPDERIARHPLPRRDDARLLLWQHGRPDHRIFRELPDLLEAGETLFFNNTKVIPARLFFRRPSGALIEVFLLNPVKPASVEQAMSSTGPVVWECAVGNLKRWSDALVLEQQLVIENSPLRLQAELLDRAAMQVGFRWEGLNMVSFSQVVEAAGIMPIPPYLNRDTEDTDRERYQTVYSRHPGAVAAPTAGLHFTPELLTALTEKGVAFEELTLHVSAGTFRPVKTQNAAEHEMHSEQLVVSRANVKALTRNGLVTAVGTTSLRTLESIYWFGVKLLRAESEEFFIEQEYPYRFPDAGILPDRIRAAQAVLDFMNRNRMENLSGATALYIMPGYTIRTADKLITNFHQPGSTLLLLVSAFVGGEHWKTIYQTALEAGYRFLSYGDSSLLYRGE